MVTEHPLILFFTNQGVPIETVILLLLLPIAATFVVITRQVIGIKAFGIYTPTIIIFAFLEIGLKYGVALYITVIIIGILTRFILKNLRLLYLPRVAITMTIVTIAILISLAISGSLQRTGLASVSIFPLLIIITLVEKFVATQIEKGTKTALYLGFETLIIAVSGFLVLNTNILFETLIKAPWAVLLVFPINIILGKWTGLRISEYFRFREIFKKM